MSQSVESKLVRNLRAILTEIDNTLREVGAPEKRWSDPGGTQVFSIRALAAERERLRTALERIAAIPEPYRNPDGVEQGAAVAKLIAKGALDVG